MSKPLVTPAIAELIGKQILDVVTQNTFAQLILRVHCDGRVVPVRMVIVPETPVESHHNFDPPASPVPPYHSPPSSN